MCAANSPRLPVVVLPKKSGLHPRGETVAVMLGWATVRPIGGHVFTAPRGTVVDTDDGVALQLTAETLTTHRYIRWWPSFSGGLKALNPGQTRSPGLSGVICRSCGPPSGQGGRDGISRVHSPSSGTAETLLHRRLRCEAPWRVYMPPETSAGHGITF